MKAGIKKRERQSSEEKNPEDIAPNAAKKTRLDYRDAPEMSDDDDDALSALPSEDLVGPSMAEEDDFTAGVSLSPLDSPDQLGKANVDVDFFMKCMSSLSLIEDAADLQKKICGSIQKMTPIEIWAVRKEFPHYKKILTKLKDWVYCIQYIKVAGAKVEPLDFKKDAIGAIATCMNSLGKNVNKFIIIGISLITPPIIRNSGDSETILAYLTQVIPQVKNNWSGLMFIFEEMHKILEKMESNDVEVIYSKFKLAIDILDAVNAVLECESEGQKVSLLEKMQLEFAKLKQTDPYTAILVPLFLGSAVLTQEQISHEIAMGTLPVPKEMMEQLGAYYLTAEECGWVSAEPARKYTPLLASSSSASSSSALMSSSASTSLTPKSALG
jgi:hypothetical protein